MLGQIKALDNMNKTNIQPKVTAGISAVAHYLPSLVRTSGEVEDLINVDLSPKLTLGSIARLTGIVKRCVSTESEYNSTLAIRACQLLFEREKIVNIRYQFI